MKAIVFGATGTVGGEVLRKCLENPAFRSVISIGRRRTNIKNPKLIEVEHINFLEYSSIESLLINADACFFCIGVFQGQVSKQDFITITCDYLKAVINILEHNSPKCTFCLFSARGSDTSEKSPFLFAKIKGRADNLVLNSKFENKYIFRPGYIYPNRPKQQEPLYSKLLKPVFRQFPQIGIEAKELATVMVKTALLGNKRSDREILENAYMRKLVQAS